MFIELTINKPHATPMGSNKHETLIAINILPLWGKLEEIRKQLNHKIKRTHHH
jgi:hypothetical protein